MRTQLHPRKSSSSSTEIDSISSGQDSAVSEAGSPSESERTPDDYSEGSVESTSSESESRSALVPICPAPVRIVVGAFSMLTGMAGMTMAIYGGIGLNQPANPQADQDRAIFGAGAAIMAAGFFGVLSTTLYRQQTAS